jgi:hypothetical protein
MRFQQGDDGAYFIDRDPKHFRKILNFLPDGEFEMHKDSEEENVTILLFILIDPDRLTQILQKRIIAGSRTLQNARANRHLTGRLVIEFDALRKGPNVYVKGSSATNVTKLWQTVLAGSMTRGVHSCTFNWLEGLHIMVGVTGDKFNYVYARPSHVVA